MGTLAPINLAEDASAILTIVALTGIAVRGRRNLSLILLSLVLGYFVGVISAPRCTETAVTRLDHIVQMQVLRFPAVFECCTAAFAGVVTFAVFNVKPRDATGRIGGELR